MFEQEKKIIHDTSTEDKMKELFDLLDQKAAAGELQETDEDLKTVKMNEEQSKEEKEPLKEDTVSPMAPSEAAAYEYSMMMQQYEAMLMDYQRREAEEEAEKKKQSDEKQKNQEKN